MTDQDDAALAGLRSAYETVAAAVKACSSGHEAVKIATKLADELGELGEKASALRARMVVRMAEEEALSLAPLAARLSVSKERAGQLMRKGRASILEQKEERSDG